MVLLNEEDYKYDNLLKESYFETKLGIMRAIADENYLYLLSFKDQHNLDRRIELLKLKKKQNIVSGLSKPSIMIKQELDLYFDGKLKNFKTPVRLIGTDFQKKVWSSLMEIPYGKNVSYLDQARNIEKNKSVRAVANANGANKLVIIVPCHRVVKNDGSLGGYSSGISRKRWLNEHEKLY